jgi:hypothetical protein
VILVIVTLLVAMWGYVVYLAFGPGRQSSPDRLADPNFAPAAQTACDAANDEVRQLPTASEARTAVERAEVLDQANGIYGNLLDELLLLAPDGEEGEIVAEWVDDWRTYLDDRDDYARRLRTDEDARLLVTPKHGDQITESIDAFAKDNRMPACGTPSDA